MFGLFSSIFRVVQIGSFFYVYHQYGIIPVLGIGVSMHPTLETYEIVLCNKWKWRYNSDGTGKGGRLVPGHCVNFISPTDPSQCAVKRVIAIEGERIPSSNAVVPRGHIWVEGDNKEFSFDSRAYGPIPVSLVTGLVTHKVSLRGLTKI